MLALCPQVKGSKQGGWNVLVFPNEIKKRRLHAFVGTGVGLSKDDPDSMYVDSRLRDFRCVQKDRVEMVLDGAATHQPSTSEVFLELSGKGQKQTGLRKQAL